MGVVAESLVAAFNPQLASWTSAPFAIEVEQHLLRFFGGLFGYPVAEMEGTFTNGGTEANQTAVVVALAARFPDFIKRGLRALPGNPTLYVSVEAHHSFVKAAQAVGLGAEAVVELPVHEDLTLSIAAAADRITADRKAGRIPFLIVGTAGSTSAGVVDDLSAVADLARREQLWFHCDAAWGGAAILLPEWRNLFNGIEWSDSITLDAHKWLSVPLTAGLYLARRSGGLARAFRVGDTPYMPPASSLDGR